MLEPERYIRRENMPRIPDVRRMLRLFQVAALVGLAYSAVQLALQEAPGDNWIMCLYAAWFVVALASVETILNWLAFGVWTLVATTGILVVIETLFAPGSLAGPLLGLIVAVLVLAYLYPLRDRFEL